MPFPLPAVSPDDKAVMQDLTVARAQDMWHELGCPSDRDVAIWLEAEAEVRAMLEKTYRHPHLPLAG
ncbi:MAG: DUF2934 domain-containing protein [Burkholderiales bacterium]|nr:DUF2934 domain-containing protein [Opitutaceae bacterium]